VDCVCINVVGTAAVDWLVAPGGCKVSVPELAQLGNAAEGDPEDGSADDAMLGCETSPALVAGSAFPPVEAVPARLETNNEEVATGGSPTGNECGPVWQVSAMAVKVAGTVQGGPASPHCVHIGGGGGGVGIGRLF
jgi:hypothetical protein